MSRFVHENPDVEGNEEEEDATGGKQRFWIGPGAVNRDQHSAQSSTEQQGQAPAQFPHRQWLFAIENGRSAHVEKQRILRHAEDILAVNFQNRPDVGNAEEIADARAEIDQDQPGAGGLGRDIQADHGSQTHAVHLNQIG